MANIRDLFTRAPTDKVPPDLRHPVALLGLNSYSDLEERFLATDAFLKPWSVFRDFIAVLAPDAMPCPTKIKGAGFDGISRIDLLWFYTQFDEGALRYDPRMDVRNANYTSNTSVYGVIDRSNWRVDEYEKYLYAWLLQEFKVGKAYSPWRFECFELKNICTAWEDVFVPIVNAVRASYDRRGKRYYGRLALFIETRCPSRLAFPESNIDKSEGCFSSPTPYRLVSFPRKTLDGDANPSKTSYSRRESINGMLSKRHYDDTEKELRTVYPQYGGLVERPKFKHKMEEWLAEQRARANRRKHEQEKHGEIQSSSSQIFQRSCSSSPSKQPSEGPRGSFRKHQRLSSDKGGESPIKQFADSIKRSFSRKEEPKSPLHGVTRQLNFPEWEREVSQAEGSTRSSIMMNLLPRPEPQDRMPSGASIYTSIRNSNPFTEDSQTQVKARARADTADSVSTLRSLRTCTNTANSVYSPQPQQTETEVDDSVFSPMAQLSAIPRPLWPEHEAAASKPENEAVHDIDAVLEHPHICQKKSYHDVRIPSYEGTAYKGEISLTDLHNQQLQSACSPESTRSTKLTTRLPVPIVPIPYSGPRLASADKKAEKLAKALVPIARPTLPSQKLIVPPPKVVQKPENGIWPDINPPMKIAWPGFGSDDECPTIPPKSPDRLPTSRNPDQLRNPRSRQLMREEKVEHDMSRIVSIENIRGALGVRSPNNSVESLVSPEPIPEPARTMSPTSKLQPYNKNMFPRKEQHKGTPVRQWFKERAEEGRYEPGGAFELEVLKVDRKEDKV